MLPSPPTSSLTWQQRLAVFPPELLAKKAWCLWRLEDRPNKHTGELEPTKVPYQTNGYGASHSNPATWATLDEVCMAFDPSKYSGIGTFSDGTHGFIDLDKCAKDGEAEPWARAIVARCASYAEMSPSGTGLHIYVRGALDKPGRKVNGCEMYFRTRYFTVTGKHLPESPLQIREASQEELEELRNDIATDSLRPYQLKSGEPKLKRGIIAERYKTTTQADREAELDRVLAGDISEFPSRSEAVGKALYRLAQKHQGDREAIQEAFEESQLCELWIEKWPRRREEELDGAIGLWEERGSPKWEDAEKLKVLEFTRPAIHGGDHDYLLGSLPDDHTPEGMFPCGEISLVGGSSGAGKSTLLYDILARQRKCESVFGRATYSRSYLIVLQDRSKRSARLTFARLGLSDDDPNVHVLTTEEAAQPVAVAIKNLVEASDPIPQVVVVEGLDMYTPDQSKMDAVVASLAPLQRVAEHYHIAIIGTVGSPKLKVREEFINDRDKVFGSVAWSRRSETIWTLQTKEKDRVGLTMMPRHNKRQELLLEWQQGRLVEVTESVLESEQKNDVLEWVLEQERITKQQLRKQFGLSGDTAKKRLDGLTSARVIQPRSIGGKAVYVVRHPPQPEAVNSAEVGL